MFGLALKKIQTFLLLIFVSFLFIATPISINFEIGKKDIVQLTISQNIACAGWLDDSFESFRKTVANWVGTGAYKVFIAGGNLFVFYADKLFSNSLYFTLVHFAQTYSTYNLKDPVNKAWTISRDFANLIIIAMFVYAAVGTILRLKDYNLEKFIVKIIIVALLINFSMFMVKFAVDVSNIIAYQFYKEIEKIAEVDQSKDGMIYIGSAIAKKIGYDEKLYEGSRKKFNDGTWWWTHFVVMPIIFLVFVFLAGVLLYGSIVMFTRFLGLMLVMALSAVGFVMLIVPSVGNKYFDQWWQSLLRYSLFAPIFSFMLLLVITIISYLGEGKNNANVLLMMAEGSWFDALFLPFLMIGLLLAAIKISNSLSIMGSNFASNLALNGISLATTPLRRPIQGITGRALGAMRKVGLDNSGLGLMLAKTYSTVKAPAHSASALYKNLGIKGLSYDQKSEVSSALKEIDATRYGQKGKMEDTGTMVANSIGKKLASVVKKASGVESGATKESTASDTRAETTKTQHADTSNYKSVVEGGPSAEAQDKEQMRAAERKAEEVAGSINKDLQSESVQFSDLDEARKYAEKILNEKLPENTDAESREALRQRQFRARRMLEMIRSAGPATKDSVLSTVNDIAKKIDTESKVVAKRFRERDFSESKDPKTAKFMDKLAKEADQMAEEALSVQYTSSRNLLRRVLGENSKEFRAIMSTLEDASLTPEQKLVSIEKNGVIDTLHSKLQSGNLSSAEKVAVQSFLSKVNNAGSILQSKQNPAKILNEKLKRAIDSSSIASSTKDKLKSVMDDNEKSITDKMRMINTYAKMTGDKALENTVTELAEYENELHQAAKAEKGGVVFKQKGVKAAFNPYNPTSVEKARDKAAKKSVWSKVKKMAQKAGELDKKLFFEEPHGPSESEVLEETLHNLEKLIKDDKIKGNAKKEVEKVFKNAKSKI